ncbi:MAG: VOC family protein [Oscillospiraceae bacterium]|nr:VOC family protein [Oscillospiraceae bacterium]
MKFTMIHTNINVFDLERSIAFYKEALGLEVANRHKADDGSFELVFLSDGVSSCKIELTWLRDRETAYDLGDNEIHIAFVVDDYDAAFLKHKDMGCVCYENTSMGLYFIEDPDGYWLEIVPPKLG